MTIVTTISTHINALIHTTCPLSPTTRMQPTIHPYIYIKGVPKRNFTSLKNSKNQFLFFILQNQHQSKELIISNRLIFGMPTLGLNHSLEAPWHGIDEAPDRRNGDGGPLALERLLQRSLGIQGSIRQIVTQYGPEILDGVEVRRVGRPLVLGRKSSKFSWIQRWVLAAVWALAPSCTNL